MYFRPFKKTPPPSNVAPMFKDIRASGPYLVNFTIEISSSFHGRGAVGTSWKGSVVGHFLFFHIPAKLRLCYGWWLKVNSKGEALVSMCKRLVANASCAFCFCGLLLGQGTVQLWLWLSRNGQIQLRSLVLGFRRLGLKIKPQDAPFPMEIQWSWRSRGP